MERQARLGCVIGVNAGKQPLLRCRNDAVHPAGRFVATDGNTTVRVKTEQQFHV